ncbi:hypothetical protein F4803DRAFT_384197 [Xylaria telfairii]|nr:hypothetical protein F4803DRAFT_384197 [Xylaria telfairii]
MMIVVTLSVGYCLLLSTVWNSRNAGKIVNTMRETMMMLHLARVDWRVLASSREYFYSTCSKAYLGTYIRYLCYMYVHTTCATACSTGRCLNISYCTYVPQYHDRREREREETSLAYR